ncbi:MAG: enoyl-CoA hydratase [Ramlibacter sp.]|nr:enoyl-CoA hydratase [Ramlibacter sp.]
MSFLIYQQAAGVVTLTMNRPEARNALAGPEPIEEFVAACDRINRDPSVRAVILTGNGPAFSAGGDIKAMLKGVTEGQQTPAQIRRMFLDGIQRIPLALYYVEVPVIAAVNGPAIGAGMDLACMCDLRIASTQASFAESFVKLGLVAGDGGAWLLPRLIGRGKASELAFTGDTIDAAEALRLGIVSRVVDPDKLLEEANALAARIAANPGTAVRLTKKLIREADNGEFRDLLESSAAKQAMALHSSAHREAVLAMVEKRKPDFKDE